MDSREWGRVSSSIKGIWNSVVSDAFNVTFAKYTLGILLWLLHPFVSGLVNALEN